MPKFLHQKISFIGKSSLKRLLVCCSLFLLTTAELFAQEEDSVAFYEMQYAKYKYTNRDSLMTCLSNYLAFAKSIDADTIISDVHNSYAITYEAIRDHEPALLYADSAIVYAKQNYAWSYLSNAFMTKGYIHGGFSDYENSLKYYNMALKINETHNDFESQMSVINNIASIQYQRKDFQNALENFNICLDYAQKLNDSAHLLLSYQNLSVVYDRLDSLQKSKECAFKQLQFSILMGQDIYISDGYNNLASVYKKENKPDSALWTLNESLKYAPKDEDRNYEFWPILNKGIIYYTLYEENRNKSTLDKALSYIDTSYQIAQSTGSLYDLINVLEVSHKYYYEKGDKQKAYSLIQEYTTIKDSLFNTKKESIIQDYEVQYRIFNKEKEILTKEKEIVENNRKIEAQKNNIEKQEQFSQLILIIGSFTILLLLAAFLYFTKKKETEKVLALKNEELKKVKLQSELINTKMLALRAQMNPHFIFNTLHSIQNFILESDTRTAYDYLSKFAKLIRLILESTKSIDVPLAKEIKMMDLYLQFEQLRFDHKFSYHISYDSELLHQDIFLQSMLIQPHVENAIIHGFSTIKADGKLVITFVKQDNKLIVTIDDNGIGRVQSDEKQSSNAITTKNTEERIQMQGGSIEITDKYDNHHKSTGTLVTITINLNK